ncbi:MAG: hypothetical protein J6B07_01620 [Opitutales bacterium]|nr:hypothetical protein [Opitutales bacterium]
MKTNKVNDTLLCTISEPNKITSAKIPTNARARYFSITDKFNRRTTTKAILLK